MSQTNMQIETVLTCPLGSKCEEARDGKVHRCAWFIQLAGTNPTTGAQQDERGCAIAWGPILQIENSAQQRCTAMAIESFRNEVVAGNQQMVAAHGFLFNSPAHKVIEG